MTNLLVKNWLNRQHKIQKLNIKKIKLSFVKGWIINKKHIVHKSGKFFKIIGLSVKTNFYKKNWDQPIIYQNEIGILGILKNIKTKKYLLQAKVEPGNINKVQISPTVQATKSNYMRVHGGKSTPYLNFFMKKKNNFSHQSEQAFRYLNKFNANIIVKISKKIKLLETFRWFSKKEIVYLLNKKNIINMDTLSVFSCFLKKNKKDKPLNNLNKINIWLKKLNNKFYLRVKKINISKLKYWITSPMKIKHKTNNFFSIIGIKVKTNKREINEWSQPIIQGMNLAFAGFLTKKFNNTEHYLCRYILKPGARSNTFSCTINTSKIKNFTKNKQLSNFQKEIFTKYFLTRKKKLYDNILSDEGGRFYQSQIRYVAYNLKKNDNIELPFNYVWLSYNQMIDLINKRKIDIEARLLFGIINIKRII